MSTQEDEFLNALRSAFKVEAAEHVQAITTGLLALEKTPAPEAQRDLIATVFRAAHNLKGAARAVDSTQIESLCQSLEDLFASWKREESIPAPATFDPAHRALDAIASALSAPKPPGGAPEPPPRPAQEAIPAAPVAEQRIFSSEDTVRITVAKLDARLVEAEEMLTAKLITSQRVEDLRELARPFEAWRNEWTAVEPDARALHQAMDRPAPGHHPRRQIRPCPV